MQNAFKLKMLNAFKLTSKLLLTKKLKMFLPSCWHSFVNLLLAPALQIHQRVLALAGRLSKDTKIFTGWQRRKLQFLCLKFCSDQD